MKINLFFIRLAINIIIIFGGIFTIRYIKTGEILLDQLIGMLAGFIFLISSLLWRKINKNK